jgi:hypothetical protein
MKDLNPKLGSKVRNFNGKVIGHVGPGIPGTCYATTVIYLPEVIKALAEIYKGEGRSTLN